MLGRLLELNCDSEVNRIIYNLSNVFLFISDVKQELGKMGFLFDGTYIAINCVFGGHYKIFFEKLILNRN